MIKVNIKQNEIVMRGHAGYDIYGRDIVCAATSGIVVTSVNASLKLEKKSLEYKEETDKVTITLKTNNKNVLIIIENMIDMLKELAEDYPKNIKIEEERL